MNIINGKKVLIGALVAAKLAFGSMNVMCEDVEKVKPYPVFEQGLLEKNPAVRYKLGDFGYVGSFHNKNQKGPAVLLQASKGIGDTRFVVTTINGNFGLDAIQNFGDLKLAASFGMQKTNPTVGAIYTIVHDDKTFFDVGAAYDMDTEIGNFASECRFAINKEIDFTVGANVVANVNEILSKGIELQGRYKSVILNAGTDGENHNAVIQILGDGFLPEIGINVFENEINRGWVGITWIF